MVQYYWDTWKHHSHVLTPITEASAGKKVQENIIEKNIEQALLDLKIIFSEGTLLNYPDLSLPFTTHTDDSDKHLGAVTSTNNRPIAFLVEEFKKHN